MKPSTQLYNGFLEAPDSTKGGGVFLEDPHAVENVVCQTAGRAPDEFESRLADMLMAVFAEDISALPDVVAQLNARGCGDAAGLPWSVDSLQAQFALSASLLFGSMESRS
jgi:hypothetical protein